MAAMEIIDHEHGVSITIDVMDDGTRVVHVNSDGPVKVVDHTEATASA